VQKSPLALSFIARKACENAFKDETCDGGGQRLFVMRSPARGRRLSNQSAVVQMVEAEGFRVVDPETLSFAEQVRMFAGSSVVIGQMGAAMANTLFCPPATTVVHLAPWGWIEPFYWDLAVVRGHFYRALFGAVTDHAGPSHSNDFVIDINALKRVASTL
jgi:capsular polysaccharide biosynthesis protein